MKPDGSEPREVELKLTVPEGSLHALRGHAAFAGPEGEPAKRRRETTTYFDTEDDRLQSGGFSLRVRSTQGRRIQTLKSTAKDSVAASRGEWEWPIEQDVPDRSLLAGTPAADTLPSAAPLVEVVSTEIDRTTRTLHLEDNTVLEAALDEGAIVASHRRESVRELELELKKGGAGPLFRLAMILHDAAPLRIATESKSARGYRLRSGSAPVAKKAEDIALEDDVRASDALVEILRASLGHLVANQSAALAGDVEGVHQMRVALRRLRSALVLFKPHLEPHATARFDAELRRLGRVFGEARDWDVFCTEILPPVEQASELAVWCEQLRRPAADRQHLAHRRMVQEIEAPAFTAVVLAMAAWAEGGAVHPRLLGDPGLDKKLSSVAPGLLDTIEHKVRRRGAHLARRSRPELHALRKSLKKLRYGIEFLTAIYPHYEVKAYLHNCKDLQEHLGEINDATTAIAFATRLSEGPRVDLAPAVAAIAGSVEERAEAALAGLRKAWTEFADQKPFWA